MATTTTITTAAAHAPTPYRRPYNINFIHRIQLARSRTLLSSVSIRVHPRLVSLPHSGHRSGVARRLYPHPAQSPARRRSAESALLANPRNAIAAPPAGRITAHIGTSTSHDS